MIILAVIFILAVLLFAIGCVFADKAVKPKVIKYDETFDMEQNALRLNRSWYDALPQEEFFIKSPYGYDLHCIYFPIEGSKKTIIFAHGITYSLAGSIKYMNMFVKRGFNVLVYDHRNHGKSGGSYTSFGYFEKNDLKVVTDWVFDKVGRDSIVGIHGESMGAATILQNAAIDSRVHFYIADCPYASMADELAYRLKVEYKLPRFPFIPIASLVTKIRYGFYFSDVEPIRNMPYIETPILFVHGADDTYIPKEASIDMYNAKKGKKKLYIAPNANHAQAFWNNQEEYDIMVEEFLQMEVFNEKSY